MAIRPISRVGSATTSPLRGLGGVGSSENVGAAYGSAASSVGTSGVAGQGVGTAEVRTVRVTFAEALAATGGAGAFTPAEARAAAERSMEALRTLAASREGQTTRVVEELRVRLEEALADGGSVLVGDSRGFSVVLDEEAAREEGRLLGDGGFMDGIIDAILDG